MTFQQVREAGTARIQRRNHGRTQIIRQRGQLGDHLRRAIPGQLDPAGAQTVQNAAQSLARGLRQAIRGDPTQGPKSALGILRPCARELVSRFGLVPKQPFQNDRRSLRIQQLEQPHGIAVGRADPIGQGRER